MIIPFSPPFIDEDVERAVLETLRSGWITSGPAVLALEKLVAEKSKVENVVCVNSATSALMLVLHWFGVGRGDEVIVPAYTYAATALAVMHVGATPVMVDAALDFNIDVNKINEKITGKTKAIIPVDIAGWPCDYNALYKLIEQKRNVFSSSNETQKKLGRILLLADSAHSIGAEYFGNPSGALADITVFSFHAVKNITTAEGGAICITLPTAFSNEEEYEKLKLWSLNGQTKDAFTKSQGGSWKYDIVYPGFKMNMPDICAAIGLAQLKKYSQVILPARKIIFERYVKKFSQHAWAELPPQDSDEKKSSYHLFALRIRNISEDQRDVMIEKISEQGVAVNVHFQPLPLLTVFKSKGYSMKEYPTAYDNYLREISLPIYPGLDESKIDFVVSAVALAYRQVTA